MVFFFFFFNDTATTEIYTLSLHDALPICCSVSPGHPVEIRRHAKRLRLRKDELLPRANAVGSELVHRHQLRSEEHTSELQSRSDLVCRLLLEKKKNKDT